MYRTLPVYIVLLLSVVFYIVLCELRLRQFVVGKP